MVSLYLYGWLLLLNSLIMTYFDFNCQFKYLSNNLFFKKRNCIPTAFSSINNDGSYRVHSAGALTVKPKLSTLNSHLSWWLKTKYSSENNLWSTALLYEASQISLVASNLHDLFTEKRASYIILWPFLCKNENIGAKIRRLFLQCFLFVEMILLPCHQEACFNWLSDKIVMWWNLKNLKNIICFEMTQIFVSALTSIFEKHFQE